MAQSRNRRKRVSRGVKPDGARRGRLRLIVNGREVHERDIILGAIGRRV